jgi:hypothetical protein
MVMKTALTSGGKLADIDVAEAVVLQEDVAALGLCRSRPLS